MDVDVQIAGTPLLWAVWHDRLEVVSFLLSVGADPQLSVPMYGNGESPLIRAAGLHHTACLQLLISHLEAQSAPNQKLPPKPILYGPVVKLAIHTSDKFSMIIRHGAHYLEQLESTLRLLHQKTKNIRMLTVKNSYDTAIGFAASQAHDEAVEVLLKLGWGIEDINHPNRENGRTPLLDAVRWNRHHLMQLLLRHGADPLAKAWNPFDQTKSDWSALHIFAEQAHDDSLTVVNDLLEAEHPIDGREDEDEDEETETPLSVAIRRNAFHLASHLLSQGADINALSTRSSLLVSSHPLTPLGHIIALNARHCLPSLRWLLSPHSAVTADTVNFVVEPTRYLTILHLCAIVPQGLRYTSGAPLSARDFDFETNRRIVHELLEWFGESEFLDERCGVDEKTALHLAAECGNVGVVEELVRAGADVAVRDGRGETAVEVARRVFVDDERVLRGLLEWLG
jgi:ankyrin repeat protein